MSLIISIFCGEGIVMASDSRTTFNSSDFSPLPDGKGAIITNYQGVHYSDTTYKTFLVNNIGISTCGAAGINGTPLTGFIEKFIHEQISKETDVADVPNLLLQYFRSFFPIPELLFQVAGYSQKSGKTEQRLYRVSISSDSVKEVDTSSQGAAWNGETEILSRIVNSIWLKRVAKNDNGEDIAFYDEIKAPPIPWNFFSLQDGIDFATYAINTTIETMRFQQRLKTVGGPIDILIIKPDGAFWAAHKTLHVPGKRKR